MIIASIIIGLFVLLKFVGDAIITAEQRMEDCTFFTRDEW